MTPIVMVHGAFVGGWSFEAFRTPFEAAGHKVLTPDLRGHGAGDPAEAVIGVSIRDYVDDLVKLCVGLDRPPILIGHSMGGLVAQLAARRVRPQATILLAPSPPWGLVGWSMEWALAAAGAQMATMLSNGAVEPSREIMRNLSLNRMSEAAAKPVLDRLRWESARAVGETLNWWLDPFMASSIGPGPLPGPSLVISGERDQVNPAATGRLVAERIGGRFQSFAGMSHWLPGEPGWRDVAAAALDFIGRQARQAA